MHAILGADHGDPFAVLGLHQAGENLAVRVFRPDARAVAVRSLDEAGRTYPALQIHPDGFFEAVLEGAHERFAYVLEARFTEVADGDVLDEVIYDRLPLKS